jgi:hypothetical protein
MSERLSLIASVAVIAFVVYAAWLVRDVKAADVSQIVGAAKALTAGVGTPAAENKNERLLLYGGLALLVGATLYTLLRKK